MKKLMFLLVMALMPMVFTSCGSDDDDNGAQVNKIVGAWIEKQTWKEENNSFYEWGDYYYKDFGAIYIFTSDGKYTKYMNQYYKDLGQAEEEGTYTFDGTYLVVNGGYKRKVTFTEDGNGFEWERTSIVVRY